MQIIETKIKVSDLCKNYSDNGDSESVGFDGKKYIQKGLNIYGKR